MQMADGGGLGGGAFCFLTLSPPRTPSQNSKKNENP